MYSCFQPKSIDIVMGLHEKDSLFTFYLSSNNKSTSVKLLFNMTNIWSVPTKNPKR